MENTIMTTFLQKAKVALRMTTDAFDEEIRDILAAGLEDMRTRGVLVDERINSPTVLRCLLTYVRLHFGDPESPDRLQRSYDEQLVKLMNTTNYIEWR